MGWLSCDNFCAASKKTCEGLTQWDLVPLGTNLTTTDNVYKSMLLPLLKIHLSKLRKKSLGWLTWRQSIHLWQQAKLKNWHPPHDLPQTYRGIKSTCPVCIQPTDNFLTHSRTSLRINERWSNKYDTKNSTINKRRFEQRNWRIF